jgi:hypothetical protein
MVYSGSFFEVSAQLIPVLFLAMVVEDGSDSLNWPHRVSLI